MNETAGTRMCRFLSPLAFFVGLGAGLLALSYLGSVLESPYLVQNFVRFHQLISVEAGFFPTARQVRAIVDAQTDPPPRVFVIIGGSSVLHGVGQHESLAWSRFL